MKEIRINKYISEAGYCSRRKADELIKQGLVTIDGEIAVLGDKVSPGMKVLIGEQQLDSDVPKVYIAYNKPAGIVCTSDPKVDDNIIDAIGFPEKIFTIGRLDKDSTGLIFLTNDGDIVNKILRAGNNHSKEYEVLVDRPIDKIFIETMESGIPMLGTVTKKCKIKQTGPASFKLILTQGLNRQIRRMCEYAGYEVVKLHRIRIMNVNISTLKSGEWRFLTYKEIEEIKRLTSESINENNNQYKDNMDGYDE